MIDKNNILTKFGANAVVEQNCFTLKLELMNQHYYANRYQKAFDVCGYFNFQLMDDVETYMEKATEYIAEAYKLDLEYSVNYWDEKHKNKGANLRIFFTDDKLECFLEGRVERQGEIQIFSFD